MINNDCRTPKSNVEFWLQPPSDFNVDTQTVQNVQTLPTTSLPDLSSTALNLLALNGKKLSSQITCWLTET